MDAENNEKKPVVPNHEAQSLGGKARAESLNPAERTAIARRAAVARWGRDLPFATHDGTIMLADKEIACAVLNTRVREIGRAHV